MRSRLTTAAWGAALASTGLLLAGCGLVGATYDVQMEVQGSGTAMIGHGFAGGEDPTLTEQDLPWSMAESVGFGFNDLRVSDAEPGTVCRILVDDEVIDEQTAGEDGSIDCFANNQDD
ncbi:MULTISPECIES: hypothetical protein [Actinoalloteichus]|uniref:Uncharacterized protein n=1 Tax=Actinoalloteichus fjordicus TaxID=1612552 RepID=A0AAC9LAE1_9PSEU|nr:MULTISPECIES: hypothetical protein [Actinoalloteichus]APU13290.1 hypothetical protein UA74_06080 [Actinoalloteichus fjordicus]APU19241.1 hypothetical protein UA75_06085 [Actinoalloteichus sp. GBA129-24]